jgi:hypothetical protein
VLLVIAHLLSYRISKVFLVLITQITIRIWAWVVFYTSTAYKKGLNWQGEVKHAEDRDYENIQRILHIIRWLNGKSDVQLKKSEEYLAVHAVSPCPGGQKASAVAYGGAIRAARCSALHANV